MFLWRKWLTHPAFNRRIDGLTLFINCDSWSLCSIRCNHASLSSFLDVLFEPIQGQFSIIFFPSCVIMKYAIHRTKRKTNFIIHISVFFLLTWDTLMMRFWQRYTSDSFYRVSFFPIWSHCTEVNRTIMYLYSHAHSLGLAY